MKTLNETNFSNHNRDAERGEHGDGAGPVSVTQPFSLTSWIALPVPRRQKASSLRVEELDISREQIVPSLGATRYTVGPDRLDSQAQGENAPFNQTILRFPGVAQDSFGQLHFRGEHANLQYPHQRCAVAGKNYRLRTGIVDPIC